MACTEINNDCGCPVQVDAECVFYRGETTACLGITTGNTLDEIITLFDAKFCDFTPSGHVYVVDGTSNQINVTSSTVGDTTTYTVSLAAAITNTIASHTASIATLTACCNASVKDITSLDGSVTITDDGVGNYDLSVNFPSTDSYDGIIYNNATAATLPNGSGTTVIVKSYNRNYSANDLIADGDQIRFEFTGKIKADSGITDTLLPELFDATGATILSTTTFGSFNTAGISSYTIRGVLDVTDEAAGDGLLSLELIRNSVDNGDSDNEVRNVIKINEDISGIDYTNLTIRLRQNNLTSLNSADNRCRKLTVDVRKYLS